MYRDDGKKLDALKYDWQRLQDTIQEYEPNEKIWITELGCSTGQAGIDNQLVRRYIPKAVKWLRQQDNLRPIFLYTFRDRPYLEAYEAEFGLLEVDGTPKPIWEWYTALQP